jgi:short-subunit dehydrogenase
MTDDAVLPTNGAEDSDTSADTSGHTGGMTGETRPLALVTGASTGIGRSLATVFAENGYDLVIAADDDAIHAAAEALRATGSAVVAEQVDLATADGVAALHRTATAAGNVAVAALNAGIGVGGRFDETDLDRDLQLVDLNCRSTVHLAKLLTRDMVRAGEGRLLFTASIAATTPGPYHATYAASKAFVHSFAEAIRVELADTGVTVTSLMPGPTDTDFFERADMLDTRLGAMDGKDDPDEVARQGFEALMAGKDHVVTGGLKNKLQTASATVLPDQVAASTMSKLTEPGSAD